MCTVFSLRLRTAPLWVITQRAVVISCRRCGITYQTLTDKTDRLARNVGEKVTITRWVRFHSSAVHVQFAAEA
jgi:hypothetical protein